jgi:hypothetical protein
MENEGDGAADSSEQGSVADMLGALLIELGHKVRQAGVEGVHILTDEEVEHDQVRWYRTGWVEHARATDPRRPEAAGHPDSEDFPAAQGRLIRFPDQVSEGPSVGQEPQPLPIVSAGDANVRELMPHRPRPRSVRERGDDG